MMLHTDTHNPSIKRHMTKEGWIKMNRGTYITITVEPPYTVKDTLGPSILSFIKRLSSLWRFKCIVKICTCSSSFGTIKPVLYMEGIPLLCPLYRVSNKRGCTTTVMSNIHCYIVHCHMHCVSVCVCCLKP